ncbi:MAG: hypothetical protein Q3979_01690 [Actinomycetaceae bacterium]|nr:hypothetical protein [Actinomycetaceae bacterium]
MRKDSGWHAAGDSAGAGQVRADGPFVSALHRAVRYIFGVLAAVCAIALFVVGTRQATRADPPTPTADFVHVVTGESHTCARTTNGIVYCWGDNQAGQSGAGEKIEKDAVLTRPIRIDVPGFITMLVAGANHTCALNSDGDLYCWGQNAQGQSGSESSGPVVDEPRQVAFSRPVTALAAGRDHTCAVTEDAKLSCWGSNRDGQIKPSGETKAQRSYSKPEVIDLPEKAAGVSVTDNESCGLVQTGDVFCWSDAVDYAQYDRASDEDAAGRARPSDSADEEDGARSSGEPDSDRTRPGSGRNGSPSASGGSAGSDSASPSGDSTGPSGQASASDSASEERGLHQVPLSDDYSKKAAAISNGPYGSANPWHCAFFASREVSCWNSPSSRAEGGDFLMQDVDLKIKLPVADFAGAGGYRIDGKGTVIEVTPESDAEGGAPAAAVDLPGKATSISSGYGSDHWCAVLASGDTYCWGRNDRGQLGSGTTKEGIDGDAEVSPVRVGS